MSNICGGASNNTSQSSCSKIFSSDKTDVLGLKLSDFSLIYFLGIILVELIFPEAQFVLRITSMISVLVILYSFMFRFLLKNRFAEFCLVIIFILLAQIAISSVYFSLVASLSVAFMKYYFVLFLYFSL